VPVRAAGALSLASEGTVPLDPFAQERARAMQATFHGRKLEREGAARFFSREAFEIAQNDHFAILRRQTGNRRAARTSDACAPLGNARVIDSRSDKWICPLADSPSKCH
jgi:hypothetical protein